MWGRPRAVACFLVLTLLAVAARAPFMGTPLLSFYLPLHPGLVLVPAAAVVWGPAAAWAGVASVLLGDRLGGCWTPLTGFRAAGVFFWAVATWRLAAGARARRRDAPGWPLTLYAVLCAAPGALGAAAWTAWGADLLRLYPFPYVVSLEALHHLLFLGVLGPPFFRIALRYVARDYGTWDAVVRPGAAPAQAGRGAVVLMVCAPACAVAVGVLAGGLFCRMWPFQAFVLGTSCGWAVNALIVPFLLAAAGAALAGAAHRKPLAISS
jgi:hypothetical protein